jgi:Penicillin-binding protein 5, C-terminal domain
VKLAERGDRLLTSVLNGEEIALAASSTVYHLFSQPDPVVPPVSIVPDELEPPIAKGNKLGKVIFCKDSEKIASVDLVSTIEVPERHPLLPVIAWTGWGLVGVLWVRFQVARRRQRYVFARLKL